MGFLSGLKAFGKDIEHVFSWAGSPTGQTIIKTAEGVVEAVAPVTIPIIAVANVWIQKAFSVESLAVAAGKSAGTGPEKAAMVMEAVTPAVLQYAQQDGVSARTAAQIQAANDAIVAFIKAMTDPAPSTTP